MKKTIISLGLIAILVTMVLVSGCEQKRINEIMNPPYKEKLPGCYDNEDECANLCYGLCAKSNMKYVTTIYDVRDKDCLKCWCGCK